MKKNVKPSTGELISVDKDQMATMVDRQSTQHFERLLPPQMQLFDRQVRGVSGREDAKCGGGLYGVHQQNLKKIVYRSSTEKSVA